MRRVRLVFSIAAMVAGMQAYGYEGPFHQKLTFIAAKQFNRCVADTAIPSVTPLQVRYVAKSNIRQAETNLFVRMFNWSYYDRGAQAERRLLWLVDTRFHKHFNDVVASLDGMPRVLPDVIWPNTGHTIKRLLAELQTDEQVTRLEHATR